MDNTYGPPFSLRFSVARGKLNKFYVLIVTDALSTGADLSKVYENNLVDLKSIRNEFQNSRGILVNYTLGALLKFGLSTLLLVGLCLAVFETLITCDSSLNCTFINYIYCPFAKVLFGILLFRLQTR